MKNNYLLFSGNEYYPEGGAWDLVGGFKDLESAILAHDPNKFEVDGGWANILCLKTM